VNAFYWCIKKLNAHENLVERNHAYSDTVYICSNGHTLIRLTNVSHGWNILNDQDDISDAHSDSADQYPLLPPLYRPAASCPRDKHSVTQFGNYQIGLPVIVFLGFS